MGIGCSVCTGVKVGCGSYDYDVYDRPPASREHRTSVMKVDKFGVHVQNELILPDFPKPVENILYKNLFSVQPDPPITIITDDTNDDVTPKESRDRPVPVGCEDELTASHALQWVRAMRPPCSMHHQAH